MTEVPGPGEVPAVALRRTPSDLSQWAVVALSQLRDYLRTYRFLGLVLLVGGVSLLWLGLLVAAGRDLVQVSYLGSVSEFLVDYTSLAPVWVFLSAAFFGGEALSADFNSGTGNFTLVLPVKRRTLLAGRFVSATAVTLVVVLEFMSFGILDATYEFGRTAIPWGPLSLSLELAVLLTLAAVAFAFCLSAFFRAPTTGVLVTALVLVVVMPALDSVAQLAGLQPWWSITYGGGAVANVLDWAYVPQQTIQIGEGQALTSWAASPAEGALILAAYLLVFGALGSLLYQFKESKG